MVSLMQTSEFEALQAENERLKKQNEELLGEIRQCRNDICKQIEVVTSVKKELRRYEVQINSLKTENEEFKNKFSKIENNPIGRLLLKVYRWLREMKRRRG